MREGGRRRERCLLCALMKYNEAPKSFAYPGQPFVVVWYPGLGRVGARVAAYFQDLRVIDLPCWPGRLRFMRCDKRFMVYLMYFFFEVRAA